MSSSYGLSKLTEVGRLRVIDVFLATESWTETMTGNREGIVGE